MKVVIFCAMQMLAFGGLAYGWGLDAHKPSTSKSVSLSPLELGTVTAVGHCDVAALSILISKGISPNLKINDEGDDLYSQIPSKNSFNHYFYNNCVDTLTLLIKSGANLKQRNSSGVTAEYRFGTTVDLPKNILELMSQYGADFKSTVCSKEPRFRGVTTCVNNTSVLMGLADESKVDQTIVKGKKFNRDTLEHLDFIAANSDINATNAKGQTALHVATVRGYINNIEYLMKHGASLDIKDKKGMTASDIALTSGKSSLMRLFSK